MPHKRYKHSKCHKKRAAQTPYNRYKRCERHKGPTQMPHKRCTLCYATPRHKKQKRKYQPERLINVTKVQSKHSINNKNAVHATNVHPQRPINATIALNATKNDPPERLINATSAVNAAHVQQQPHKNVRPQRPMKKLQKL